MGTRFDPLEKLDWKIVEYGLKHLNFSRSSAVPCVCRKNKPVSSLGQLDEPERRRHWEDFVAGQPRLVLGRRRTRGPSAQEDPQVQSCLQRNQLLQHRAHRPVQAGAESPLQK